MSLWNLFWMIPLGLLALMFLLTLLPVRINVKYDEQLYLKAGVGPLMLRLLPAKPKAKDEKKKTKKAKAKKKKETEAHSERPAHKLSVEIIRDYVRFAFDTLGRFRRLVRLKRFGLHAIYGGKKDAGRAAMAYGGSCAAVSVFLPLLESGFGLKLKDTDISVDVDFEGEDSFKVDAYIRAMILPILVLSIKALVRFMNIRNKSKVSTNTEKVATQ